MFPTPGVNSRPVSRKYFPTLFPCPLPSMRFTAHFMPFMSFSGDFCFSDCSVSPFCLFLLCLLPSVTQGKHRGCRVCMVKNRNNTGLLGKMANSRSGQEMNKMSLNISTSVEGLRCNPKEKRLPLAKDGVN